MSTQSICTQRLTEERKSWRKDHPFGFFARPDKVGNTIDLTRWSAGIPGKPNTDWEGGLYKLKLIFPPEYPQRPPVVRFSPPIFHPNVYDDGDVCLSIVDADLDWKPSITIKQILLGVQELLDTPNPDSPASSAALILFVKNRAMYSKKIKQQALAFKPVD